jgi:hypothetical protein
LKCQKFGFVFFVQTYGANRLNPTATLTTQTSHPRSVRGGHSPVSAWRPVVRCHREKFSAELSMRPMRVIQERPNAMQGQVVIRPMMYVALTYEHRIVDGREAAAQFFCL